MGAVWVVAALLWGAVAACADTPHSTEPGITPRRAVVGGRDSGPVPGRHIVTTKADPRGVAAAHGLSPSHVYTHVLNGFAAEIPEQALDGLRRNPNVESIIPDNLTFTTATSWGLDRIDARSGLDGSFTASRCGSGAHVYVIDSGIDTDHPEFTGRIGNGVNVSGASGGVEDVLNHGTHVSGTAAGTTFGAAPCATLHPVRVFGTEGSTTTSTVIAGMDWVVANRQLPCVVNMSLGGSYNAAYEPAIASLVNAGCFVSVSAGNSNADACGFTPAAIPESFTVGSTSSNDFRSSFSNWGSCVDGFAPGSSIKSAIVGGTGTMSGTSMSAPHVTGVAALYLQENHNASPAQVEAALKARATKGVVQDALSANFHLVYSGTDEDNSNPLPPEEPEPPPPPTLDSVKASNYQKAKGGRVTLTVYFTHQEPGLSTLFSVVHTGGKASRGGEASTKNLTMLSWPDLPAGEYQIAVSSYYWFGSRKIYALSWTGPVYVCATGNGKLVMSPTAGGCSKVTGKGR